MRRQRDESPYCFSAIVARVSPSATVYDSPAAGDRLGDGLGDGDATDGGADGGSGGIGVLAGDGLAAGAVTVVDVGAGGFPPTHPQAMIRTVPTTSAWTSQRGFRTERIQIIVTQPYGLVWVGATVFGINDAGS